MPIPCENCTALQSQVDHLVKVSKLYHDKHTEIISVFEKKIVALEKENLALKQANFAKKYQHLVEVMEEIRVKIRTALYE